MDSTIDLYKKIIREGLFPYVGEGAINSIIQYIEYAEKNSGGIDDRVEFIENTKLKILYYNEINGGQISGNIQIPKNTTILFDQWENGVDAVISKIENGKPNYLDTGLDVISFNNNGDYILSGVDPNGEQLAFIYYISVKIKDISSLNYNYIIDQSVLLSPSEFKLQNVINVAKQGGDFTTIKEALESITDNGDNNRYVINVAPGIYEEDNPIQLKSFVSINGIGNYTSTIKTKNNNQHLIVGAPMSYLINFSLTGVTGVDNYAVYFDGVQELLLSSVSVRDCSNGILLNGVNSNINLLNFVIYQPIVQMNNGINVLSGKCLINTLKIIGDSYINTLITVSGSDSFIDVNNIVSNSDKLNTAFNFFNGCIATGNQQKILNSFDGLIVSGNDTNVILNDLELVNSRNDGVRVDNIGNNIKLNLYNCYIKESNNLCFNLLNENLIVTGSGFTQLNKIYRNSKSQVYAQFLDITKDDEGLNIFGELRVGTPEFPSESVFGEGDSYSFGLVAYTWDGSNFIDVSEEASSSEGSTFTFPNGNIGTALYISTKRKYNNNILKHYGIKYKQTKAGGNGSNDIEVTGNGTPINFNGGYNNRNSNFNGNPVYIHTSNTMWIFNIQGYWVLNNQPPEQTQNYFDAKYISVDFEGNYTSINSNTGSFNVEYINNQQLQYFQFEYYNSEEDVWKPFDVMITMGSEPYIQMGDLALNYTGSFHARYNILLKEEVWGANDPMGLGENLYWIRIRIINNVLILPEFEQIKIHTNRTELNKDGFIEYFGVSRPVSLLPWDLGLLEPANSIPDNSDIYISDNLGVGRKENLLKNGAIDRLGFNGYLSLDIDTSCGIYVKFSFIVSVNTGGVIRFVIRSNKTNDGYSVYNSTTQAPTTSLGEKEMVILYNVPDNYAYKQMTLKTRINIQDMVSRKLGKSFGVGDIIWVTIERTSTHTDDTLNGDVILVNIQPLYFKWCEGGHI